MSNKIFDQLSEQLNKAKLERPKLEGDSKASGSRMLDESTGNTPKPAFFHVSHNSHGDWHKHWAHGDFEEDQNDDSLNPSNILKP